MLVGDGIAMSSTMMTAIVLCRAKNAREVTVAVPVAGREVAQGIEELTDRLVALEPNGTSR